MPDQALDQQLADPRHAATAPQPGAPFSLPNGGELGALIRAKDWSRTPLGPIDRWPQSLRTAASMVLYSAFPSILLWGPELVQVYNDHYRLLMGEKHPAGLGQATRECWPEVWHINREIFPRVLAGETVSFDAAKYPLAPHGVLEDYYLTLSYSPVFDESGGVGGIFVTVFDVTAEVRARAQRDRANDEARAERERLHEVFMQAPAAIAVLEGPAHTFTVANPRYRELVGGRNVVGKPVLEALPEIRGQGFVELLDGVRTSGTPFVAHEAVVRLDRGAGTVEDAYLNFVYQPLRDAAGDVTGILAHAVDVTEQVLGRRDAERKAAILARLTHDLERSNRELDQFAYVASHDLKAPLRGIANLTQWIEEDAAERLTDESREHMRLLKGRVHRMEALIDGILTYSRAGRVRAMPERVATAALVHDVVELLDPPGGVTIDVAPDMPIVESERTPLQQVFLNLIGNAVKYSSAGRPDAHVRVDWRQAGDAYEFTIGDNGPGIPPEFQERVWGIFQTLQARDKVEGTGIGLSVVKKIVESRGGEVRLDSAAGHGARFHFTWPRTPRPTTPVQDDTP